ncbi:MAG: ribonuclease R [Candidatus Hydrogenedentota bacterium]|uniref:Ribonuclease R n=1 Tax=Sumerlaea chitinivorans TaxID=2250252 RepID=A0A2Z4Y1H6_SUMC1|nr:3'-to-5' exoribonuclease RNase R [Candidatus Sumerlaea chitinivorans]RMH23806.1 MAG: ribonuclease R [Candidatus Hydrogenedentota bacterium]GIX44833.1 MAG: ribonuclease R [Candidatus Sumerlaea sp.]
MMEILRNRILDYIRAHRTRTVSLNELMKELGLPSADRRRVQAVLHELCAQGQIIRVRGHHYGLPERVPTITGILHVNPKGFGFVTPDEAYIHGTEPAQTIFIPLKRMHDALHGDRVMVRVRSEAGKSPEGEVVKVLERGTRELVGTFYFTRKGGQVIPRNERITRVIFTERPHPSLRVKDGVFVLAEITEWTPANQPLYGRVKEVLGDEETAGIDVTVIIRDAGVDPDFPPEVLAEAEALPSRIPQEEYHRRMDLRNVVTFTMDGATAKDFDDALSIEPLPDNRWLLGVHIADVAYYVREGSALDREAFDRGTSIYPVDRVVPMLPERLSNDLCSLRPNEDRLALSCFMEIDRRGRVHEYSIRPSIIRSRHRLIYEQVQEFMEGRATPEIRRKLADIRPQLDELYQLRRVLTDMRLRRGALDLDIPETEVHFAPDGSVTDVVRRQRLEAHRVVEECMLIANEVVATHLFRLRAPAIYRVHDEPDKNKLRQLQPILAQLGVRFPARKDITSDAIQIALERTEHLETGFIARRLILRAMMQAHYSDENIGHYGLASPCYTHFTSPIRRYPDLIVHRILHEVAAAGAPMEGIYEPLRDPREDEPERKPHSSYRETHHLPPPRVAHWRRILGPIARHSSERERRAQEIEYQAIQAKSLEYIRQFLGQEFEGYITSVLTWGFFVELREMPIEGLVHVRNLEDDYYEYDEERMVLVGRESGRTFKLGDRVIVAVEHANLAALELDFALVEHIRPRESTETDRERWREKQARKKRHAERRPTHGGFQKRGRRRRSR